MKTNEEKWTAYALNELPEDERRAVEAELETNPEARKAVEETRKQSALLTEHYAAEENIGLTDEQREAIYAAARKKRKKEKIVPFPRKPWIPMAIAASISILFVLFSGSLVIFSVVEKREVAFCPPTSTPRPKMSLHKAKLRAPRQELYCTGRTLDSSIVEPAKKQWGPSIEDYTEIKENLFTSVANEPLSTFSIDVDSASYANVRRFLEGGMLPPKDAVRIEEMINYFDYSYEPPHDGTPFATHLELSRCPWDPQHKLVRIGLKGRVMDPANRPPLNLVFLMDVSGSMNSPNKLPLVKQSLDILTRQLDERDRVSIVVYAGASGLVLPPTSGADRNKILDALKRLQAGGGTNGGQGIELAYKTALENFHKEGVNRVILCTDGDFNIGVTQGGDLNRLIEDKAKSGIFLSVLGFGMGNYKDSTLEGLADKGNGNYAYIDTFSEARKVLVDQMSGTLVTIAKDVKIQVEFNPARVAGYRLIGYENRMLAAEDFNDDTKDAGEIGAGHTVTALYEIVPAGQTVNGVPPVDELKYQVTGSLPVDSSDLLTVKLRYKQPDGDTSSKLEFPLKDKDRSFEQADDDFRFATAVAGFGMMLRDSELKDDLTYDQVIEWAQDSLGKDEFGYRREFIDLVRNAKALKQ
ncbi:YfbK domain-containing protein [Tichowtungia aerotolerans]|nr:von Willebrand factor type A domain-containing protein [Tichowtungia aerotolerans]